MNVHRLKLPYKYEPLTNENLVQVYELFKDNEKFYQIPLNYFKKGTIDDDNYDPDLTLILINPKTNKPIAAFIAIIKKRFFRKACFLKASIVEKNFRRQGIGSRMLNDLLKRAKNKLFWKAQIRYGDCHPHYWQPGVDLRHTDLFFFLKKHGFREKRLRFNLLYHLDQLNIEPKAQIHNFNFERVSPELYESLLSFVEKNFRLRTWAEEVRLSFDNDPPTTFIVKDYENKIVGWATHSQFFPGSFGPTGVLKSLRGKGIGSELLYWCISDMKRMGLDKCIIFWVVGNTIKYYSKTLGAYLNSVFYSMTKRI